ncbi:hypothetical protein [Acetobacter sp.]|uniref:hypothetical protein n=1 Tax=Acetobacter sp. TaxID=440 RepID=UPI0039EAD9EE
MREVVDIRGQRFGKRVVIGLAPSISGRARFYVRCDCGDVTHVFGHLIRDGKGHSCRKCQRIQGSLKKKDALEREYVGKRIGLRTIEGIQFGSWGKTGSRGFVAETVCECGYRSPVSFSALKRGIVNGCISCSKKLKKKQDM